MFLDSTLTTNRAWVMDFCEELLSSGVKVAWSCNARVDTVDEDMLRLMKRAGCWEILFGVESANQKSLDSMNKGVTVEENTKAIRLCLKLGYYTYATYILGWPGENVEDAKRTVKYATELGTHLAMFYLPVPFPKTRLWDICEQTGGLRANAPYEDYSAWDLTKPVYVNPQIGKERMQWLLKWAYTTYYTTPKVIWRNIEELLLLKQSPRRYIMGLRAMMGFLAR
jgi:radical SAM superfamily enzyme YgiQ (UPF0313 family)